MQFYEWLQRRALRRADAVVAVSRPLAEQLSSSLDPSSIHTVLNRWGGGEREPFEQERARKRLGLNRGGPVVGWVGRLSREKGPDVFLEMIRCLEDRSVTGCLVGDGPLLAPLQEKAEREGPESRVRFPGRVPHAARLMRAFDVFVLSSRSEGTPMVLFEAMSAGIPIVAAAVGGVPDVVSNREAILVPPERPDALAEGVRRTLANREATEARVERATERLRREFSTEGWAESYGNVYNEAVRRAEAS